MPSISIIVPIYNMEKMMRKCLDSILAQTFQDYECLLIDDGSKDGSSAICDEYAACNPRFTVYHKPNGGLSDARNYGLERAKGKYTIFVDPDDWIDPEGMDKLYETAERENADMIICDFYRENETSRFLVKQKPSSLEHQTVLKELFSRIHGSTCNKLIKRELYSKYDIKNPKGIYGCEDQYVMASFLLHNIKVAYCPVAFYHYMYNINSLTRYYDENTYQNDITILKMFSDLLSGTDAEKIAYEIKYYSIITRAFWNGGNYYSSKSFKERFYSYKKDAFKVHEKKLIKCCIYLSCIGFYQPAIKFCFLLFNIKKQIKKLLKK